MIYLSLLGLGFGIIQALMRRTFIGTSLGIALIYFSLAALFFSLTAKVSEGSISYIGSFYIALFGLLHVGIYLTIVRRIFCKTGWHQWSDLKSRTETC